MNQMIGQIALVVKDYDEAISFYVDKLGFLLVEDTEMSSTKRWVVVRPLGTGGCNLLLAKAANEQQLHVVGNQTGGRVFLFMYTDDIHRDHQKLVAKGITIVRELSEEPYGTVMVFSDLYGNLWDLIQPTTPGL
jgi:catechol 2,3-dioxygenase-like lactoylglutathione lyase family enzyme